MIDFQLKVQKPLKELVYLELKHKILTGEIAPQTRLMEIELSEKMNVSRTPIREAIKRLADDGLAEVEPRKGAHVANISIKDMLDVFEVRENMEGFAAQLAAERITENQKEKLLEIAAEYEASIKKPNKETIIELDEKFHNFIVECCNNPTLNELIKYVQDLSLRFRYLYYDDFDVYYSTVEHHNKIAKAIVKGNKEAAREEADKHVKALKEFVNNLGKKIEIVAEME
ncbi:MAG: GntR family transcriptional regulator [Alphaproteobacteria bacterium]|nr:GntR family transcriptional regulator [Alphaproteobacteria bacterium]